MQVFVTEPFDNDMFALGVERLEEQAASPLRARPFFLRHPRTPWDRDIKHRNLSVHQARGA
jgi:hypothetical protein